MDDLNFTSYDISSSWVARSQQIAQALVLVPVPVPPASIFHMHNVHIGASKKNEKKKIQNENKESL